MDEFGDHTGALAHGIDQPRGLNDACIVQIAVLIQLALFALNMEQPDW